MLEETIEIPGTDIDVPLWLVIGGGALAFLIAFIRPGAKPEEEEMTGINREALLLSEVESRFADIVNYINDLFRNYSGNLPVEPPSEQPQDPGYYPSQPPTLNPPTNGDNGSAPPTINDPVYQPIPFPTPPEPIEPIPDTGTFTNPQKPVMNYGSGGLFVGQPELSAETFK